MDAIAKVDVLDIRVSTTCLLKFGLVLLCEPVEVADDKASVGAVIDEEAGSTDPALQVVERKWDVLGVIPIKDPNLSTRGRFGDAMAVVVEQDALVSGVSPQCGSVLSRLFGRGV